MSRPEKRRRRCCSGSSSQSSRHRRAKLEQQQQPEQPSFDGLPPEVLEMVLRFLPYRDIAGHIRLISRRCSSVATSILNSAFLSFGVRLRQVLQDLESGASTMTLQSATSDLPRRVRARNSLEFVLAQYELLRAVAWRYTHPPASRQRKFPRLCFYAGEILDELESLLGIARSRPAELVDKDGPAQCVAAFVAMCKRFMNHFEKLSERRINRSSLVSGCKLVDVLDCLLEGREALSLRLPSERAGAVSMRLRYVLERAWFTCLEVPGRSREPDSWRDQQRFMYLRLRRLVGSVNEHLLERRHYERELLLAQRMQSSPARRHSPEPPRLFSSPKPPPCSTYSGYGECGGSFFYYGNMNEHAYDSKVVDMWRRHSARDRLCKRACEDKPCYDLVVNVDLECSPELAPLAVRSMLKCDDFESTTLLLSNRRPELYLKMSFSCPASESNKLPGHFIWELRNPRRYKLEDN